MPPSRDTRFIPLVVTWSVLLMLAMLPLSDLARGWRAGGAVLAAGSWLGVASFAWSRRWHRRGHLLATVVSLVTLGCATLLALVAD